VLVPLSEVCQYQPASEGLHVSDKDSQPEAVTVVEGCNG